MSSALYLAGSRPMAVHAAALSEQVCEHAPLALPRCCPAVPWRATPDKQWTLQHDGRHVAGGSVGGEHHPHEQHGCRGAQGQGCTARLVLSYVWECGAAGQERQQSRKVPTTVHSNPCAPAHCPASPAMFGMLLATRSLPMPQNRDMKMSLRQGGAGEGMLGTRGSRGRQGGAPGEAGRCAFSLTFQTAPAGAAATPARPPLPPLTRR